MEICSESIDHFNRSERKLVQFISSCCMSHYHRALLPGTPTLLRGKIMLDKLLIRIMSSQAKRLKQQRDTNKLYKTIIRERGERKGKERKILSSERIFEEILTRKQTTSSRIREVGRINSKFLQKTISLFIYSPRAVEKETSIDGLRTYKLFLEIY